MGSYSVEWKRSATKELRSLPHNVVLRVLSKVEELSSDPYPDGVKKLVGAEHTYRARVGDYRIVYSRKLRFGEVLLGARLGQAHDVLELEVVVELRLLFRRQA
jgi:mRNA interferase RelE/StbE